jgi:photosystem II stability/assembly factor-like uncharacterized protein
MRAAACLTLGVLSWPFLAVATARAAGCEVGSEQRDAWHAIGSPKGVVVADTVVDDDPCRAFAVTTAGAAFRSVDGGTRWTPLLAGTAVSAVFTEGLGSGRVAISTRTSPPDLLVSADAGRTFARAGGLPPLAGWTVSTVVADPSAATSVYAVLRRTPEEATAGAPSIYRSTDGGRSFAALAGSVGIAPTAIAVDPADADRIWANNVPAVLTAGQPQRYGLFLSVDGGETFGYPPSTKFGGASDPALLDRVESLDVSVIPGGGSVLYAATDRSVIRTTDGGSTFDRVPADVAQRPRPFAGVRIEPHHPAVAMTVSAAGDVTRSTDSGATMPTAGSGLPFGCHPTALRRSAAAPALFTLRCAGNGRTYRFRATGADLVGGGDSLTSGDQGNPDPVAGNGTPTRILRTTPMRPLRTIDLPHADGTSSGSLAFDGKYLYYSGTDAPATDYDHRIHRVTTTGVDAGVLAGTYNTPAFSYDGLRNLLYVENLDSMVSVDLFTGRQRTMFPYLRDELSASGGSPWHYNARGQVYSYDPSIDRFLVAADGYEDIVEVDRTGVVRARCTVPYAQFDPTQDGNTDQQNHGPAGITSSGDGGAYLQGEDDRTVVRLGRGCRVQRAFAHRTFSEAKGENDSLACDTVTFKDTVAIWVRDADTDSVTAYEVPGGYCALATRITVTNPPPVAVNGSAAVCARLILAGRREPIPGELVTLFVDARPIGTARTDADGRLCATYRPALAGSGRAGTGTGLGRKATAAVYAGTIAYRPASARGALEVTGRDLPVPIALPGVVAVQPLPANPIPNPGPQPNPQLNPQARPQVQPEPQPQPQPQAQPQGQPQAQAQANLGVVPQAQEQVQVESVQVMDGQHNAVGRVPARRDDGSFGFELAAAAMLGAATAGCAVLRPARASVTSETTRGRQQWSR